MRFILLVVALVVTPVAVFAQDYDCSDFSSQAEAQRFFEQAGPGDRIISIVTMTVSPATLP